VLGLRTTLSDYLPVCFLLFLSVYVAVALGSALDWIEYETKTFVVVADVALPSSSTALFLFVLYSRKKNCFLIYFYFYRYSNPVAKPATTYTTPQVYCQ
jgi:ABC-type tungstate transport system substrate-binding protein